jgi:KRAB domain-containing zinc finger protein
VFQRHVRVMHKDGDDLFICRVCGRPFAGAKQLQLHELDHLGYPTYESSKQVADPLNMDLRCKICEKAFTQKADLWDHSLKHRDFMPYKCLRCDFKTCSKKLFQVHLEKEHGESYEERIHGCKVLL